MAIIKRTTKGSALTHAELDGNFDHLDSVKVDKSTIGNNQLLYRDKDGNLTVLTVNEQELVGRLTGGNIDGLDATTIKNLLSLVIADVGGLQTALDAKAATAHNHIIADVTDLATELSLKSDIGHEHAVAGVSGLQGYLDARPQWLKYTFDYADITSNLSGTSGDIDIINPLPVNTTILAAKLVVKTAFSGGGNNSLSMDFKIDNPNQTLLIGINLFNVGVSKTSDMYYSDVDNPSTKLYLSFSTDVELNALTAGEAELYFLSVTDTNAADF